MIDIKICGLTRPQDLELAAELGAGALGIVLEPSSPRFVKDPADLAAIAPEGKRLVAVFGRTGEANLAGFTDVQAVEWRGEFPGVRRIKAVRLRGDEEIDTLLDEAAGFDALLIDAYKEGAYGGTGERANWELAAEIVRRSPIAVHLAGGLTPENVGEAIRTVRPYGVDVSSGVEEAPGVKDPVKIRDFIAAARDAGQT